VEKDGLHPLDFSGDMIDFMNTGAPVVALSGCVPLESVSWAPPVTRPTKIIAVGLNYKDHAQESKGAVPSVPLLFAKFPNSLIGHREVISWDRRITNKVDFEAELAVIIGKTTRKCAENEAAANVFGYTCANDVSARDLQFGDGQWVRGKSLDTFCPLGPWVVTADELNDPGSLKIRCILNGQVMQDSSTGLMFFGVAKLVSFCSMHFTLSPGDVILTGTPNGVGAFREPSIYMQDGDEVIVDIEKIGRLVNRCKVTD
jgi:2-keto-4-pentenoate hydratase/2-oxohepta-3-ene-1,7-dioic acid hydratase in catechol pathway